MGATTSIMNTLCSKYFHTIFISDNSNFTDNSELIHYYNFLQPDIAITAEPVQGIDSYNLSSNQDKHCFHNIYITQDIEKNKNNENRYIIVSQDIMKLTLPIDNAYFACGLGAQYKGYCNVYRSWFGKHENLSWIIPATDHIHASFCLLYINKKTYNLTHGIHNFQLNFHIPRTKDFIERNNIFSDDFDLYKT